METVTIRNKNKKALNLLKRPEELDIIKIDHSKEKLSRKDKASKYRGSISAGTADALLKHAEESRNEWEERFPAK